MMDRLFLIFAFGGTVGTVCMLSMLAVPHRGWMKLLERFSAGLLLCIVCHAILSPFDIPVARTPFTSFCAGILGLPGVALGTFVSFWP